MVYVRNEEVAIFEVKEQAQVDEKGQAQQQFPTSGRSSSGHKPHHIEIYDGSAEDDKDELWCAPGIKQYAAGKDNRVLILFAHCVVNQEEQGQEVKDKYDAAKNHGLKVISISYFSVERKKKWPGRHSQRGERCDHTVGLLYNLLGPFSLLGYGALPS